MRGGYLTKEYSLLDGQEIAKRYSYDFNTGNRLAEIDARGGRTSYEYDAVGRLVKTTLPDNGIKEYSYEDNPYANFKIQYTDPEKTAFSYEYDIKGNLLKNSVFDRGAWRLLKSFEFDAKGNKTKETDANGHSIRFEYDSKNRIVKKSFWENDITDKGSMKVSYTIGDAQSTPLLVTITDEEGYIERFYYDVLGRLTKSERTPDNAQFYTNLFTYDYTGNKLSETDGNNHTTRFTYDSLGRLITKTDALGMETKYTYNALNKVTLQREPDGKTTEFIYDGLGRLSRKKLYKQGAEADYIYTSYVYDPAGNVLNTKQGRIIGGADSPSSDTSYAYDAMNRVIEEATKMDESRTAVVSNQYNRNGNKTQVVQYADADKSKFRVYSYGYDYAGKVSEETGAYKEQDGSGSEIVYGSYLKRTERDYAGNTVKEMAFNGSGWDTTTYTFNYRNKPILKTEPFAGSSGEKRTQYQYDKKGNLLTETLTIQGADATTSYKVDGLGRTIVKVDPLGNMIKSLYDAAGNLIKETDPRYPTQTAEQAPGKEYKYDALNRLVKTTVFDGTARTTVVYKEYDGRGNVVKEADGEGYNASEPRNSIGSVFEYDVSDKKITFISAQTAALNASGGTNNVSNRYTYDGSGNVLTETDAAGNVTRYSYYLNGLLKEKTFADGYSESYDYDLTGKAWVRKKDRAGRITTTFQTIFDKPYRIDYPDGTSETFRYSAKGDLIESVDQAGNAKYMAYDPAGNPVWKKEFIRSDQGYTYHKVTRMRYDEANHLISSETFLERASQSDGADVSETSAGDKTDYIYDKAGRLTRISGPFGRETIQEYDRAGNMIAKLQKVEEGNYDVRRFEYDIRSLVTKESLLVRTSGLSIDSLAGAEFDNVYADRVKATTTSTYYKNGKLKSKADAYGKATFYEYDYDGRPVKKTDPLKAVTTYGYDLKGNLVRETNSKGIATVYDYDAMNKLIRKSVPAAGGGTATIRYLYDAAGNLVKQIAPNDYDPAKDIPALLETLAGMIYVYDAMNRRTATIAPDGQGLEYIKYTGKGQVEKIVNGVQYNGDVAASPGTSYVYDGLGKVLESTDALGGITRFAYDVLGNLVTKTDARNITTTYAYNPDGTLALTINPDGGKISYSYDKLGRKTSETNPLGSTTTYSYNAFGKEKTVTDAYGFTVESKYDLNGNVVLMKDKRGSATLMKYDANGKMVEKRLPLELDGSGNVVYAVETYVYDSLGNLLKKSVTDSKDKSFIRETTYTYYDNNLQNTTSDNGGGYSKKYYDRNGNVIKLEKQRDAGVMDIEKYVYDSQNRMIQRIRLADEGSFAPEAGFASIADLRDNEYPGKIRLITGYAYDAAGNKIREIDPRAYAYPATDTANRDAFTFTFTYDALNRLEKSVRQWNGTEVYKQYSYDEVGNKIAERSERGFETRYTYDYANRVLTVTDPEQQTLIYQYDLAGNKISETNAKGYATTFQYDKLNRLSSVTDPNQVVIQHLIYDPNGNVAKKIDAKGYKSADTDEGRYGILYEYDLGNRAIKVTDPEHAVTKTKYNAAGQKVQETNGLEQTFTYAYDAAGRLIRVTDPLGVAVTYEYDNAGNKLYMTDGRGKITRYSYGAFGWLLETANAEGLSIRYHYDLAGNAAAMTDRIGNHTVYAYDNRNLLLSKNVKETGDSVSYTYDEAGNRLTMTDASGTSSYTYDKKNQLLSIAKDGAAQIYYTYDVLGNIESVTDKTGVTTAYSYDKLSRVETVLFQGKKTVYSYDENGNRTSIAYDGGVTEEYSFDKNNKLLTLTNKKPDGSTISSYSYTYDAAGRQTSKTDSYGTTNYTYDASGRIEKVEAPGKTTLYTYDRSGNRQTLNETYTSVQPSGFMDPNTKAEVQYKLKKSEYVYSSTNELLKLVEKMYDEAGQQLLEKTTNYLYDANGNEIRQMVAYLHPHTRSMRQVMGGNLYGDEITDELNTLIEKVSSTYDGFNQLKQMEKIKGGDRVTVDYTYNGDGLRTKKVVRSSKDAYAEKVTNYLYDRQNVILETDAADQVIVRYVRGINYIARIDSTEKLSYYLYNGHGDVVQTVSAAGEVENQYDYDIFGNPTLTVEEYGNAIRYAGEFFDDETGLYYLRARYYNPYTGRFTTEDTYAGQAEDPLSLNRYTYVLNNPLMYKDPTGHWEEGDENLSPQAQDKIMELTEAYYNATTDEEREAIHERAESIRNGSGGIVEPPTDSEAGKSSNGGEHTSNSGDSSKSDSTKSSESDDSGSSSDEQKTLTKDPKEAEAQAKEDKKDKAASKPVSDGQPMLAYQVNNYVQLDQSNLSKNPNELKENSFWSSLGNMILDAAKKGITLITPITVSGPSIPSIQVTPITREEEKPLIQTPTPENEKVTTIKDPVIVQETTTIKDPIVQPESSHVVYDQAEQTEETDDAPKLPNQGTVTGNVEGAPKVDAGKQGKHVPGHNNFDPNKSSWGEGQDGVDLTQEAWMKGTPTSNSDKVRVWDAGEPVGPNGETGVRVHMDSKGNIHGYPVDPNQYLP
nr:RHS repeat-associated core domain-containing protein [Paenibacillus hamazuiensis]